MVTSQRPLSVSDASSIPTVLKDEATRTLILEATESNTLFEGLDLDTRLALIDVMTKKRVDAECDVIAQGAENDDARHFYVLEKGKCGERSLMGSEKRAMRAEVANPSLCAG